MLGLNLSSNSTNLKLDALGNFLTVLFVQLLFQLYDLLALERFPTEWEFYRALIVSFIATMVFYGYNKVKVPQET